MPFKLNYDEMIFLDAEELAETGIGEAYGRLLPELCNYVPHPAAVEDVIDNGTPRYSVRHGGKEFLISAPELPEAEDNSWGRATHALFAIVNAELDGTRYRFYAINNGNDLGGMFLTPFEALDARDSLPKPTDWPYLPTVEPPWYGQSH